MAKLSNQWMGTLRLSLLFLACNFACPARADLAKQHLTYDRLLLPGGRAAMLGGAYTALSDDPSGLFYNPAGIVQGKQNQVSLNTWSNFRSEVVFKEAIKGRDFVEKSNTYFGGFAGGVFHKKALTLGYVISTLDKRNINQDDYFQAISDEEGQARDFTRIHQESNSFDMFGLGMALALNKSWSIGGSGFYYSRNIEAMDYQQVLFNGGQVLVQESKIRVSNQGFHGMGGIQYHGDDLSMGMSVRAGQSVINRGSLSFNSVTYPVTSNTPDLINYSSDTYDDDTEVIPFIYRAGAAWHPANGFLLSTELSYSTPVSVDNGTPDRQPTYNYAIGLETGPTYWKIMLGLFTNNTKFPKISSEGSNQAAHLDYLGKSIGTSIITKSFDLHVGYIRQDGQGHAQIIAGSTQVQKVVGTLENLLLSFTFKL
jgi:hypothetical protein